MGKLLESSESLVSLAFLKRSNTRLDDNRVKLNSRPAPAYAKSFHLSVGNGGKSALVLFALALLIPSSQGCGESGPATGPVVGVVTLDGEPLQSGSVRLSNAEGYGAIANVQEDGSFRFETDIEVGTYTVTVLPPEPPAPGDPPPEKKLPRPDIPRLYQSEQSSPLTIEVTDSSNELNITLEK